MTKHRKGYCCCFSEQKICDKGKYYKTHVAPGMQLTQNARCKTPSIICIVGFQNFALKEGWFCRYRFHMYTHLVHQIHVHGFM